MAGSDYEARKDVLVFKPGETAKHIDITIIDDDEWEENEVFFIKLSRFDYKDDSVEIGGQSVTEVTIINDDGKGLSSFQMTVESNYVIAIATLSDWLKRFVPVFQPMKVKTKTNRTMYS